MIVSGTLAAAFAARRIVPGVFGESRRLISAADVAAYASLLGDDNPVHTDAAYAATTPFKRPIAHGMLSVGLIPAIFGSTVHGCIYVSQDLRFRRPVFVGDTVVARITVTEVRVAPSRGEAGREAPPRTFITCDTRVFLGDGDGDVAVDGKATVMLPT